MNRALIVMLGGLAGCGTGPVDDASDLRLVGRGDRGLAAIDMASPATGDMPVVADLAAAAPSDLAGADLTAPVADLSAVVQSDMAAAITPSDYAGCMSYLDLTQAQQDLIKFGGNLGLNYSPQCSTVKIGERVVWFGDLNAHPFNMAKTNPVVFNPTPIDGGLTQSFNSPGYYGFYCGIHGAGGMAGVVHVIQ